ncbi:transcriptional regulator, partial [Pseudomonas aeruginosa]
GQGLALERRSLVPGALPEGRLVQSGQISVPYPYPYCLVWPQRERPRDRRQAFADWLREGARRFQAEQPPLSE